MLQYYFWQVLTTNTNFLVAIRVYNKTDRADLWNVAKRTEIPYVSSYLIKFLLPKS